MSEPQDRKKEQSETPDAAPDPPRNLEEVRAVLDFGVLGIFAWDLRAGRMTWLTNLADFHGPAERELDGALAMQPGDIPAQEYAPSLQRSARALRHESHAGWSIVFRARQAEMHDGSKASATVIIQDGAVVQLLGMCRDITERLRVNREVRVRARQQETLARLGERALTESDLQKFFNEVVETICDILDVEMVQILESIARRRRAAAASRPRLEGGACRHHHRLDRARYAGRLHARVRAPGHHRELAGRNTVLRRAAAAPARRGKRDHRADRRA